MMRCGQRVFLIPGAFRTAFVQTRPMVLSVLFISLSCGGSVTKPGSLRQQVDQVWQNTAMPTAAAKLLNPRYMQIDSRNARFKTEMEPSIRPGMMPTRIDLRSTLARPGTARGHVLVHLAHLLGHGPKAGVGRTASGY